MKKGKKLVSAALALTMAFSVGASAFAVSAAEAEEPAYTPTYNDRVTEEKTQELISFLDTTVDGLLWGSYGNTVVNEILGLLASLPGSLQTAAFWQGVDSEVFAGLTDPVSADSMKAYLAEHPMAASTGADVVASLEKVLPDALYEVFAMPGTDLVAILPPSILEDPNTGGMISMLAGMYDGGPLLGLALAMLASDALTGIDNLVEALNIEHGDSDIPTIFAEMAHLKTQEDKSIYESYAQSATDYVMGVVKALVPNTIDKVLSVVKTYSNNQAAVLSALTETLGGLTGLVGMIDANIGATITSINDMLKAHAVDTDVQAVDEEGTPAVDDEGNPVYEQVLDLDGLVNQLLVDNGVGAFVAVVADGEESTAMLKLSSINDLIASIADEGVSSSADVLMVAYNYLYDNIFTNDHNYTTIKNALPLIANFLPDLGLDEATVQMITDMIPTITSLLDQLKAAGPLGTMETLMTLLGVLEEPTTPTDPTEPGMDAGDNTNPGTGDAMFAVVAGAGVLAAGAVVVLAKKRKAD